jgi:hypothetical protein
MGKSRSEAGPSVQTPDEPVGRRALLRRAATVAAAGIGGVAAAEMLSAGPASAATGDPLLLGSIANDAGTDRTSMTSGTTTRASLEVANTGLVANVRLAPVDDATHFGGSKPPLGDPGGTMKGGELLNLTETVGTATNDTLYWMAGDNAAANLKNLTVVLTTATGTVFAPVPPSRLLDTRSAATRHRVLNNSALDANGRLLGGQSLVITLDDLVEFAYSIHFNLTATAETASGYLTVYPGGAVPVVSNLNFGMGKSIANSGLSPLSATNTLSIYASHTTHVILDLQGWTLPDFSFLKDAMGSDATPQVAGRSADRRSVYPTSSPKRTRL